MERQRGSWARFLRGKCGKRREEPAPVAFGFEDAPHLIATGAEAVELAMLQFNACRSAALGDEADLDFGLQVRVVLPVGGDVPGQHQPRRRLPGEHAAPLARAAVLAALVPAAADMRLHDRVDRIGLADLVDSQRPPRSDAGTLPGG